MKNAQINTGLMFFLIMSILMASPIVYAEDFDELGVEKDDKIIFECTKYDKDGIDDVFDSESDFRGNGYLGFNPSALLHSENEGDRVDFTITKIDEKSTEIELTIKWRSGELDEDIKINPDDYDELDDILMIVPLDVDDYLGKINFSEEIEQDGDTLEFNFDTSLYDNPDIDVNFTTVIEYDGDDGFISTLEIQDEDGKAIYKMERGEDVIPGYPLIMLIGLASVFSVIYTFKQKKAIR